MKELTPMQNLYIAIAVIIVFYMLEIYALIITEIAFLISKNIYFTAVVGIFLSLFVLRKTWIFRKSMINDTIET